MAEDKKEPKKSGEFRVPPRTWILWIAILGAIPLLVLFKDPRENKDRLTASQFLEYFHSGAISDGVIWWDIQSPLVQDITGHYRKAGIDAPQKFTAQLHIDEALDKELRESRLFEPKRPNTLMQNMLVSIVPILLIALLI